MRRELQDVFLSVKFNRATLFTRFEKIVKNEKNILVLISIALGHKEK